MPRPKRSIQSTATVEGFPLIWHLHREQQWCDAQWRGVAIHVRAAQGTFRELFLEYPPAKTQKTGLTQFQPVQQNILAKKVETHIRQAIEAGWDPGSRGQPFVFEVEELPS